MKKMRKRNQSNQSVCDDEEQPGPSSQLTPGQRRKPRKIRFCECCGFCFCLRGLFFRFMCHDCFHFPASPLKKGEKGDIWTWAIFKSQLPVTCGDLEGTLNRDRLARGEREEKRRVNRKTNPSVTLCLFQGRNASCSTNSGSLLAALRSVPERGAQRTGSRASDVRAPPWEN